MPSEGKSCEMVPYTSCFRRALVSWLACVALVLACDSDGTVANGPPEDNPRQYVEVRPEQSPLFSGTTILSVTSPYRCQRFTSIQNLRFEWESSGHQRLAAAVLSEEPRISGRVLENKNALLWVWTTAAGRNRDQVRWSEGYVPDTKTGLPTSEPAPASLDGAPRVLWFAVWTFDDDTRALSDSSEARPFFLAESEADACEIDGIGALTAGQTQDQADDAWYCFWCLPKSEEDKEDGSYGCPGRLGCCAPVDCMKDCIDDCFGEE